MCVTLPDLHLVAAGKHSVITRIMRTIEHFEFGDKQRSLSRAVAFVLIPAQPSSRTDFLPGNEST